MFKPLEWLATFTGLSAWAACGYGLGGIRMVIIVAIIGAVIAVAIFWVVGPRGGER